MVLSSRFRKLAFNYGIDFEYRIVSWGDSEKHEKRKCDCLYSVFPHADFWGATLPFEVMPIIMQKIIGILPLTQGMQLMKAAFLGIPLENALLPVIIMSAVTLICFGISIKCFKWE